MNTTENNHNRKPRDQVYFIEYTIWTSGQHFMTVMRTHDAGMRKELIGRVFLVLDENKKATYIGKDPHDKELFRSNNIIELKKQFKEYGKSLDVSAEKGEQQQSKQISEVRSEKESKSKDNSLNR